MECYHPGEQATVEGVLGKDAPLEVVKARTGFNSDSLCLSCLTEFTMDTDWDEPFCPQCGSNDVETIKKLIGVTCPKCRVGVIREIETGILS